MRSRRRSGCIPMVAEPQARHLVVAFCSVWHRTRRAVRIEFECLDSLKCPPPQVAVAEWTEEHAEWKDVRDIALRMLNGDHQAKLDAIEAFDSFSEISHLGSSTQIVVHENGVLEAKLAIHASKVIPTNMKSLLKSGKLSAKSMPIGRFNELYQDYVCSCVLRVGRELMAVLTDEIVIVTALDDMLNSATGHMEERPILSVAFSRSTVDGLSLDTLDPSDSMRNFVHTMSFKKGFGFSPVSALDALSLVVTV